MQECFGDRNPLSGLRGVDTNTLNMSYSPHISNQQMPISQLICLISDSIIRGSLPATLRSGRNKISVRATPRLNGS